MPKARTIRISLEVQECCADLKLAKTLVKEGRIPMGKISNINITVAQPSKGKKRGK